jgi:hypothetical protein
MYRQYFHAKSFRKVIRPSSEGYLSLFNFTPFDLLRSLSCFKLANKHQ